MSEFKREGRYIVIKQSDGEAALGKSGMAVLRTLCELVDEVRTQRGKSPFDCVVVESDWPEYEPTWEAIQRRVESGQPQRSDSAEGGE